MPMEKGLGDVARTVGVSPTELKGAGAAALGGGKRGEDSTTYPEGDAEKRRPHRCC